MKRHFYILAVMLMVMPLACACGTLSSADRSGNIPFVYSSENTGAGFKTPKLSPDGLSVPVKTLPDPLTFTNGKKVTNFRDWEKRRAEIAAQIQFYETGAKPAVDKKNISARMAGDTLIVDVTVNGKTLTLSSKITYPSGGKAPYPIMIGTSMISLPNEIFTKRNIAMMVYRESQVNNYSQFKNADKKRGGYAFDRLYPELTANGAYIEWAWGLSRLIDGLEMLGPEVTKIDTRHIGVTGCSYAGKMALFCGAFDERVALTIAQEPGGGGAAAWRVSHTLEGVEDLEHTDYNWFLTSMKEKFSGDNVNRLPHDRHELCAMVFPRALLVIGNTDYKWLADASGYVSENAALKVWEKFGIGDRMGYTILGGHPHCRLPEAQYPEVEAFVDKFLLDIKTADTNVRTAPDFKGVTDLTKWINY